MKTKEFITIMRKIIREEVRSAIRQELTENRTPNVPRKKLEINTGNSLIDEILSETVVPRGFGSDGPAVSMEDDYVGGTSDFGATTPFVKDYSAILKRADEIANKKH